MKTFEVHFNDGKTTQVEAQRYRREGEQYVFESDGDTEVQFFVVSEVRGIVEARPSRPMNLFDNMESPPPPILPGADL